MDAKYQLDSDERIERVIRRHWFSLVPIWVSTGAMFLVVLAAVYAEARYADIITNYAPLSLVNLFVIGIAALGVLTFLIGYWVNRENLMIITNKHVIQVHQGGLFDRRVSQLPLGRVEDVSGTSRGILETMLGFGLIEIQTAGEEEKFDFPLAPEPQAASDYIMDRHEQFLKETGTHNT